MFRRGFFSPAWRAISLAVALVATAGLVGLARGEASLEIDLLDDPDTVRIDAEEINDRTGSGLAACDVNGDGIDDLLIGATQGSGPGNFRYWCGESYILNGRRGAWTHTLQLPGDAAVRVIGQDAYDSAGVAVACADVNGDGFGDLLLCANNADSIANTRPGAGQAHLILGSSSLPSEIDLAATPGTVIYGEFENVGGFCGHPTAGDINGDGVLDLVLDDASAPRRGTHPPGSSPYGRVYVLFGRSTWPTEIDLALGGDLTVYGERLFDRLGNDLLSGDLDQDGTDELIMVASGGDGPDDERSAAGDTHVFRGRPTWPAEIDLAVDLADIYLYGADPEDQAGSPGGLALGDLDGDGERELTVGARLADGRNNDASRTGEIPLVEPGPVWPSLVDLRTQHDGMIYGASAGDRFATFVRIADINGDGRDDLAANAPKADGPEDTRPDAGEVHVIYGRTPFPAELDMGAGDADLVVFGALENDNPRVMLLADLNGDGLSELVLASPDRDHELPAIWIVSPYDVDGDGITQLPDNCPLVHNPGQADSDGDLRGDACALDWDGDGQEDTEDCAPADADNGTPSEVLGLAFEAGSHAVLIWNPATFAGEYDISRGSLTDLDGSDFGSCQNHRDPDLSDTLFEEDETPLAGTGFFLLVNGRNLACKAGGTLGTSTDGDERQNQNPDRCP